MIVCATWAPDWTATCETPGRLPRHSETTPRRQPKSSRSQRPFDWNSSHFGVDVIASARGPIRSGFAARASMTMGVPKHPWQVAGPILGALGRRGTVRPG